LAETEIAWSMRIVQPVVRSDAGAGERIRRMLISKATRTFADSLTLLNCRRLPARLNSTEVAVLLGVQDHDVSVLTGAKLLAPLGKPAANAPKYFAAVEVANERRILSGFRTRPKYWRSIGSEKTEESAPALRC